MKAWANRLVNQLCEAGLVKNIADIYALTERDKLLGLERVGEKSTDNLLRGD